MPIDRLLLYVIFTVLPFKGQTQIVEYYFRFTEPNRNAVNTTITRTVSIDNIKGDTIYAFANQQELDALLKLGYKVETLPLPSTLSAKSIVMASTVAEMANWDRYPTYEVYRDLMKKFEADYPNLCKLDSIGTSINGRKLYVLKISDNVLSDEPEPEVFYTSTMHGDETTGYILLLRLADYLLSNYNTLPEAKLLIDNLQIFINPNANPDGTYNGGNATVSMARRYNANNVDLNRNFPDLRAGLHPDGNQWQPETQAMMNFAAQRRFVLAANFHGGAEVVNYPWDTWTSSQQAHPDNDWFIRVCRQYADSAQANSPAGYMNDLNNGITNGGDWYVVTGGRQDYMNYYHRCREITVEVSSTKLLGSELLPDYWNYNRAALLAFLKNAMFGIKGTVKNTQGEPIGAEIFIVNHDRLNSSVKTNPANGHFFRTANPGIYDLAATANGYKTKVISGVSVPANAQVEINFVLDEETATANTESFETSIPERFAFTNGTWNKSNVTAFTGTNSMKSATIGNSQTTSATLNFQVREPGGFSFYHKASSEEGYDFFRLYIDDKLQGLWSGQRSWEKYLTVLNRGNHVVRFEYTKDGADASGSDCVFIDDVQLPKSNGSISLTTTINSQPFANLMVILGDSSKQTNSSGVIALTGFPLDTILPIKVFSEANRLGDGQVSTCWQKVSYAANFSALFSVNFEITSKGSALPGALVAFNGEQKQTDPNGKAIFLNVPFGTGHTYTITKDGYNPASGIARVASDTLFQINTYPTLVESQKSEQSLTLYPNPASEGFWIKIPLTEKTKVTINLCNSTGQTIAVLYNGQNEQNGVSLYVNRKHLNIRGGMYFVKVVLNSTVITKKIVFTE